MTIFFIDYVKNTHLDYNYFSFNITINRMKFNAKVPKLKSRFKSRFSYLSRLGSSFSPAAEKRSGLHKPVDPGSSLDQTLVYDNTYKNSSKIIKRQQCFLFFFNTPVNTRYLKTYLVPERVSVQKEST